MLIILGTPYPSYMGKLQSAVIAISYGLTADPPSSYDKVVQIKISIT